MHEADARAAGQVVGRRLGAWHDPEAVFLALFADERAGDVAWLDDSAGEGWSYLAASAGTTVDWPRGVFAGLAGMLPASPDERSAPARADADADALPDGLAFRLGVVGWIPYDAWTETVPLHHAPPSASAEAAAPVPAAALRVDRLLAFDHAAGEVWAVARAGDPWPRSVEEELARVAASGARPVPRNADEDADADATLVWRHDDATYLDLIRSCQESIRRGDAYQLCLTNSAAIPGAVDAVRVHVALRALSPTHHGAFLRVGGTALVSASPERFVEVDARGTLRTLPIKGTRPRHADPAADARARADLLASEKERAENVMIVDLMRNDLSRVCVLGSVRVTSLFAVEAYAQVHQLVSRVEGELAPGVSAVDAVRALFPAGSMTGAPKSAAVGILAALEGGPRGVYAGAFGWFGDDGRVDLAMVIRSVVVTDGRATVGAGGGITALSVPEEELEEVRVKAAPLLAAVRAGRLGSPRPPLPSAPDPARPAAPPTGSGPHPRVH
ncbi:anthranilate synthase component I family protein [Clavibacter nebraskensis]|uniref:Anthranilate synthase component I n=2 Tax=Clavibacter nebraskensis TaxID=31963 RepID=A0AAI9EJ52_9MICO|nr:anthranilate synthase component I family protein [Clavibacter nebraskensis]KXU20706.1 anthranilate synthase [Clavibacter nebraskensis]OAH20501.1 anthranilate synthase [Clavibacter nebraskensis]QGV66689.1 anthranilate synthase component I family protein [Clavibacter nebraskensis]QGV69486.1 anthranilate synthase component I family protein [Clavibacter nebraskensis]QGV72276.1 anthranilate synthase component I family protein [Clavibacter nebraskensis]